MSKKSRISFEIKIKYVQNYLSGKISISDVVIDTQTLVNVKIVK